MEPEKHRFSESHEWVSLEGRVATIGISRFAVEQLTDLVYLDLPAKGAKVFAGEAFGEIESVKAVSELYSPVDGEVIEVNDTVVDDPAKIAADPYGTGWMIKVRLAEDATIDHLLDHAAYQKQIAEEPH